MRFSPATTSRAVSMSSYCPDCERTFALSAGVCPYDETDLLPEEDRDDPFLGTVLDDRYRLDSRLGGGGMGVVYRARQLAVDRDVAVKLLRNESDDPEAAHRRFSQEARHISALSHPNIVQLIDFGHDPDLEGWFLVMEHVRGVTLRSLLNRGRLHHELALEILYQVCAALSESHHRDTVHRDLKPQNLQLMPVVDGTLQVKVLDFGIARCVEKAGQLTRSGKICGSPAYMSPEQARGAKVGPAADFYALGVIAFEMLTGRLPYTADEALQYMYQTSTQPFPRLSEVLPESEHCEHLQAMVDRLSEKEAEDRLADAGLVRTKIEEIRSDLDLPLHRMAADLTEVDDLYEFVKTPGSSQGEMRSYRGSPVGTATVTTAYPTLFVDEGEIEIPETVDLMPSNSSEEVPYGGPPQLPNASRSSPPETPSASDRAQKPPGRTEAGDASFAAVEATTTITTDDGEFGRNSFVALAILAIFVGLGVGGFTLFAEPSEEGPKKSETTADPLSARAPNENRGESQPEPETSADNPAQIADESARHLDRSPTLLPRVQADSPDAGSPHPVERSASPEESIPREPTPQETFDRDESPASAESASSKTTATEDEDAPAPDRSKEGRSRRPQRGGESKSREEDSSESLRQMLKNGTLRKER